MRPVNLIPHDERRGSTAPTRTGQVPYAVLGVLGVVLLAVVAVVLTSKQIDDRQADKATLQAQEAQTSVAANGLAPYAQFAQLAQARETTVAGLAQSRFDWERVMRELALVLPDDVWLTQLSGAVSPDVQVGDSASSNLSAGIAAPSLTIDGCGTGHEAVAGFLEALKDIDGVTRVGVSSSERDTSGDSGSGGSGGDGSDCKTREFISQFSIVVAFDNAAVTAGATAPTAPAPVEPAAGESTDPQLADASQAEQQSRDSSATQTDKARNATNIVPGVAK